MKTNGLRHIVAGALLALFAVVWFGSGCKDSTTAPGNEIVFPDDSVSYSQHVQPYFNLRCAYFGCHEDQTRAGNLSLTSYTNTVFARPGIVVQGNSASSLLMQKIDGRLPHPLNVPIIINENQLNGIKKWIDEGGKNN